MPNANKTMKYLLTISLVTLSFENVNFIFSTVAAMNLTQITHLKMRNRYLISFQGFLQNPWTNKSGVYPPGIIRSFLQNS
jgi:hypothetical protein